MYLRKLWQDSFNTLFSKTLFLILFTVFLCTVYICVRKSAVNRWKTVLESQLSVLPDSGGMSVQKTVSDHYTASDPLLFWTDSRGHLFPYGDSLIMHIRSCGTEGLDPGDYHLAEIDNTLEMLQTGNSDEQLNASTLLELLLTDAFVRYACHQYAGRIESEQLNPGWTARIGEISPLDSLKRLDNGISLSALLNSFECQHKMYHLLKETLQSRLAGHDSSIAAERRKIIIGMERLRWLPRSMPAEFLVANIPGFYLQSIRNDSCRLDMKIIAGTSEKQTPVFQAKMTHLVLNPWWEIPSSIVIKEMLPLIRKDRNYFARHHIRVYQQSSGKEVNPRSVNWRKVDPRHFRFRLRQTPGPWNALGRVKFIFPNNYDVYFHDTPQRELFVESVRTFSHGCIRIEKPLELAAMLLGKDTTYIRQQLESGEEQVIYRPGFPMVFIIYQTAWVNAEGTLCFAPDVYGYDKLLGEWLDKINHTPA